MTDFLIQFKWLIFIIAIAIISLIFRKEVNKLIDWIIAFKKVSKTKDGYSASTYSESAGTNDPPPSDKKHLAVDIDEVENAIPENNESDEDWHTPFFEKDYTKASEILRNMISNEKDSTEKTRLRALLGHVIYLQDRQKGIEYFDELIRTGENGEAIYEWYEISLLWDNDYSRVVEVMQAGIKQHPKNQEFPVCLASAFHKQGKSLEAVKIIQENIDQHAKYENNYLTLMQILIDNDMSEEAINCCKSGIQQCPLSTKLFEKYIETLPEKISTKKRLYAYLRLSELQPDNYSYWTMLGNEYLTLGFNDKAIESYYKGNELAEGKQAWVISNIGNIMKNQGFYTRGAEFLQQAVSIAPNSQYAHERLAQALKLSSEQQKKCDEIRNEINQDFQKCPPIVPILEKVQKELSQQIAKERKSETPDEN